MRFGLQGPRPRPGVGSRLVGCRGEALAGNQGVDPFSGSCARTAEFAGLGAAVGLAVGLDWRQWQNGQSKPGIGSAEWHRLPGTPGVFQAALFAGDLGRGVFALIPSSRSTVRSVRFYQAAVPCFDARGQLNSVQTPQA